MKDNSDTYSSQRGSALLSFSRTALIISFALALVLIGADELRRKSSKKLTPEEKGRLTRELRNENDIKEKELAKNLKTQQEEQTERARLRNERTEKDKEASDPTSIRSLLNRLLK